MQEITIIDTTRTLPLEIRRYVSIANNKDGSELAFAEKDAVLSVAAFFHGEKRRTRLIDNIFL